MPLVILSFNGHDLTDTPMLGDEGEVLENDDVGLVDAAADFTDDRKHAGGVASPSDKTVRGESK